MEHEDAVYSEVTVGQLIREFNRRCQAAARIDPCGDDVIENAKNSVKIEQLLIESKCEPYENPVCKKALINLIACYLKIDDAPCSAETHLMTAISLLSGETAWRPTDEEGLEVIDYANETTTLLHQN